MECTCDQTEITVICGYCKESFVKDKPPGGRICVGGAEVKSTDLPGNIYCPKHKPIMICGGPGETCQECRAKGWIVIAGYGGPPYAKNSNTGEIVHF